MPDSDYSQQQIIDEITGLLTSNTLQNIILGQSSGASSGGKIVVNNITAIAVGDVPPGNCVLFKESNTGVWYAVSAYASGKLNETVSRYRNLKPNNIIPVQYNVKLLLAKATSSPTAYTTTGILYIGGDAAPKYLAPCALYRLSGVIYSADRGEYSLFFCGAQLDGEFTTIGSLPQTGPVFSASFSPLVQYQTQFSPNLLSLENSQGIGLNFQQLGGNLVYVFFVGGNTAIFLQDCTNLGADAAFLLSNTCYFVFDENVAIVVPYTVLFNGSSWTYPNSDGYPVISPPSFTNNGYFQMRTITGKSWIFGEYESFSIIGQVPVSATAGTTYSESYTEEIKGKYLVLGTRDAYFTQEIDVVTLINVSYIDEAISGSNSPTQYEFNVTVRQDDIVLCQNGVQRQIYNGDFFCIIDSFDSLVGLTPQSKTITVSVVSYSSIAVDDTTQRYADWLLANATSIVGSEFMTCAQLSDGNWYLFAGTIGSVSFSTSGGVSETVTGSFNLSIETVQKTYQTSFANCIVGKNGSFYNFFCSGQTFSLGVNGTFICTSIAPFLALSPVAQIGYKDMVANFGAAIAGADTWPAVSYRQQAIYSVVNGSQDGNVLLNFSIKGNNIYRVNGLYSSSKAIIEIWNIDNTGKINFVGTTVQTIYPVPGTMNFVAGSYYGS